MHHIHEQLIVDGSGMENSENNYQHYPEEERLTHKFLKTSPSLACSNEINTVNRSPISTPDLEKMDSHSYRQVSYFSG
jgi:hypothetical protein